MPNTLVARTLAGALVMAGCSVELSVDSDTAEIRCRDDRDCPAGWTCVVEDELCLKSGSRCGDGSVDVNEECDDGNDNNGDACLNDCARASCGDLFVFAPSEECDDGNLDENDACLSDCKLNVCGDGFEHFLVEECDDGNASDTDACPSDCSLAGCGDGHIWEGFETCDDGNAVGGDGCSADCQKIEVCGDAVLDEGEQCDDANTNPNDGCNGCVSTSWTPSVLLGLGEGGGHPSAVPLGGPDRLAVDNDGNVYVSTQQTNTIYRIDAGSGRISLLAGIGVPGWTGDGGPARLAAISVPRAMAVDDLGRRLCFTAAPSAGEGRIRCVDLDSGIIETVAGTGENPIGPPADGELATEIVLLAPAGLATDGLGNLFVNDWERILRIGPDGRILTVAGGGAGAAVENASAFSIAIYESSFVIDAWRDLYFLHDFGRQIWRIVLTDPLNPTSGVLNHIAGDGNSCTSLDACGDGGLASSGQLGQARDLAFDPAGNLLFADPQANRVRRVEVVTSDPANWTLDSVVGSGASGTGGDGNVATDAELYNPVAVAVDRTGVIYLSHPIPPRIRRVDPATGLISTAGGASTRVPGGDDAHALGFAAIRALWPVAGGSNRMLFVDHEGGRLRRASCDDLAEPWTCSLETVAGTGELASTGDGGPAQQAALTFPTGIVRIGAGNYLVATLGQRIRYIQLGDPDVPSTWTIDTIMGASGGGPATEGLASAAQMNQPWGLAADAGGRVYFADTGNHVIRRLILTTPSDPSTWTVETVAGTGARCTGTPCGTDGPALATTIGEVRGLAIDSADRIYVVEWQEHQVRRIEFSDISNPASGTIERFAGSGDVCIPFMGCGDGGPALTADIGFPTAIALDGLTRAYINDTFNQQIRVVDMTSGTISLLPGVDPTAEPLDFGPLAVAGIGEPVSLSVNGDGDLWVATHRAIRVVDFGSVWDPATAVVWTLAGRRLAGDGPFAVATLGYPVASVDVSAAGDLSTIAVSDGLTGRVRLMDATNGVVGSLTGYAGSTFTSDAGVVPAITLAPLGEPAGIAYRPDTRALFLADRERHVIRLIDLNVAPPTHQIVAGVVGTGDYRGGPLQTALFDHPSGLLWDSSRSRLLVADTGNHVVRAIDFVAQTVDLVAGIPQTGGFWGDGVDAAEAIFNGPEALALGPGPAGAQDSLYIADVQNHRIRRLEISTNTLATVLGTGFPASGGDGEPARLFDVNNPGGMAVDSFGNLFVTSTTTVRRVSAANGYATGDGAVATVYGSPPRTRFPDSVTQCLTAIDVVPGGDTLWFMDRCVGLVVQLDREN